MADEIAQWVKAPASKSDDNGFDQYVMHKMVVFRFYNSPVVPLMGFIRYPHSASDPRVPGSQGPRVPGSQGPMVLLVVIAFDSFVSIRDQHLFAFLPCDTLPSIGYFVYRICLSLGFSDIDS